MTRILLTGGGTGGHIYPLLAVLEELKRLSAGTPVSITYIGPKRWTDELFKEQGVSVRNLLPSKLRRYASFLNVADACKFPLSVFQALWHLYWIMPDVVFSKGGPGALPVILAARLYRIPVMIHDSDSVPGLTSRISSYFAARIGISFAAAAEYFPKHKVAFTGNPVRNGLLESVPSQAEAKARLGFRREEPLLLVLGGSSGSERINSFFFGNLAAILERYQILHQVGEAPSNVDAANDAFEEIQKKRADLHGKYHFTGFLETNGLRDALAAADCVVSRAGSGAMYEIAAFGRPAVLIPLRESAGNHQRMNAFEYAQTGGAAVIEEDNLTEHIFLQTLEGILAHPEEAREMGERGRRFFRPDAGEILAKGIFELAGARVLTEK